MSHAQTRRAPARAAACLCCVQRMRQDLTGSGARRRMRTGAGFCPGPRGQGLYTAPVRQGRNATLPGTRSLGRSHIRAQRRENATIPSAGGRRPLMVGAVRCGGGGPPMRRGRHTGDRCDRWRHDLGPQIENGFGRGVLVGFGTRSRPSSRGPVPLSIVPFPELEELVGRHPPDRRVDPAGVVVPARLGKPRLGLWKLSKCAYGRSRA